MADTVIDPVPTPVQTPAPVQVQIPIRADHKTRFTPEMSRRLQAKAQAARIAKRASRLAEQAEQAALAEAAKAAPVHVPDKYVSTSLARARQELDRLYHKLQDPELSPAEIDKIASAISKFSEIERNLAMRPAAGTAKIEPKTTQSRAAWLLGADPIPTQTQSGSGRAEQE